MARPDDADLELTVYFDAACGLCSRVAAWLEAQPKFVPLHCVAAQSTATTACPIQPEELLERLTVTASDGAVYHGTKAWIICLWALRSYRSWALTLASDRLWPTAERLFGLIAGLAKRTRPAAAGS